MTSWIILLILLSFTLYINSSEKESSTCFNHFGCINYTLEWFDPHYRSYNLPPLGRHVINTKFLLLSATPGSNVVCYDQITSNPATVNLTAYNTDRQLMILIHDFTSNGYTGWIKHMALVVSDEENRNVISVDWQEGAEAPYVQAISNARVVALETEMIIAMFKKKFNLGLASLHIIGHGVGAHIAGYIGKAFHGEIGRITGLDPSGPRFENMPPEVRLHYKDAIYVEVLHTDGYYQGTMQPLGNVDFYFNNGNIQPGCPRHSERWKLELLSRNKLKEGSIMPGCSHKRSFKYYLESFNVFNCSFLGVPMLKNIEEPITCEHINHRWTCATIGINGNVKDYSYMVNEKYNVITGSCKPFCLNRYQIEMDFIQCPEAENEATGYFDLLLTDAGKNNLNVKFNFLKNESRVIHLGETITFPVWTHHSSIRKPARISIKWHFTTPFCFHCRNATCVTHISVIHVRTFLSKGDKPLRAHFCSPPNKKYVVLYDKVEDHSFYDCTEERSFYKYK